MDAIGLAYIVLGLIVGGVVGWMIAQQRLSGDIIRFKERLTASEKGRENMGIEFQALASRVAKDNNATFLDLAEQRLGKVQVETEKDLDARKKAVESLVEPIKENLEKLEKATTEMEKSREGAYQGLKRTVEGLQKQTVDLRDTNIQLSTALRGSITARGNWGQISLKNIAESAGMLEHCDFDVEFTLSSGKGGARVDMIAKIPDGGTIPIDAKVPLASYWDALEIEDPDARAAMMTNHAKEVKKHIDDLYKRDYPNLMSGTDFTVMFIPAEPILSAAFEIDPSLQEYGFRKHILIATPVTLIGLLRTVGIYWQQQSMADNAEQIHKSARAFYDRAAKFGGDLAKVGRGLTSAVNAYNSAVGSYDRRIIPAGRDLEKMRVADSSPRKLPEGSAVDSTVRNLKNLPAEEE
ncbi:MAG: DNA recombination protein RmuC [Euryarchaeota archaeon]|nr:DNA recombination protein RmuC [Euryarchaeota archaeon]